MNNKLPKIITVFFLFIFAFQLASLLFLLATPKPINAAIESPTLQVPIGDFDSNNFTAVESKNGKLSIPWIGEYIDAIYKYAIEKKIKSGICVCVDERGDGWCLRRLFEDEKIDLYKAPRLRAIQNTGIQKILRNCTSGRLSSGVLTIPRKMAQ
jgi:hypothetical protein